MATDSSPIALRVYTPSGPPSVDAAPEPVRKLRNGRWGRLIIGALALWLFLAAIAVMKEGAAPLGDLLKGSILTDSIPSTLGFGWLGALLVMSGSPVAVAALTMLGGDAITAPQALAILTGSRLGASFVVLTVAFLYAVRSEPAGGRRRASVSIGIYCLVLTAIVYLPALAIALPLLRSGMLDPIDIAAPGAVLDIVDTLIGPVVDFISGIVPSTPGLLFLAGLALLLLSVRLVDLALPEAADAAHLEDHTDWRSRKWRMFAVGSLVALVTMSVSVALTVLVPAVAKGYFRRRQVMPYIMGANITTLGDTLLTAFLVGRLDAIHVVLAELFTITVITVILLAFFYETLQVQVTRFTDWILDSRPRLIAFIATLFVIPLILVFAF
jgi:Na+/phosphate symporter